MALPNILVSISGESVVIIQIITMPKSLNQQIFLPKIQDEDKEPLYIGFFHTGAYQDAISGYGGIKHCLVPSPKHIVIDRDKTGNYVSSVFRDEQQADDMLKILGY